MASADDPRRAGNRRFARGREALVADLRALLGPRAAPVPLDDADGAAAIAAESRATLRDAEAHGWAVVRHEWAPDDRTGIAELLHALSALLGARDCWLVVPGREPQAVALASDAVLDNPLGFAALADGPELLLVDRQLPAGLALAPAIPTDGAWTLEVWGSEPWLSAATRAVREWRARPAGS